MKFESLYLLGIRFIGPLLLLSGLALVSLVLCILESGDTLFIFHSLPIQSYKLLQSWCMQVLWILATDSDNVSCECQFKNYIRSVFCLHLIPGITRHWNPFRVQSTLFPICSWSPIPRGPRPRISIAVTIPHCTWRLMELHVVQLFEIPPPPPLRFWLALSRRYSDSVFPSGRLWCRLKPRPVFKPHPRQNVSSLIPHSSSILSCTILYMSSAWQ